VCLVLEENKTIEAVAKELDLTRMKLARLRKKNRELRVERDVLRKAKALFARNPV